MNRDEHREKFTKNYVDCILNNKYLMNEFGNNKEPFKSCQFPSKNKKHNSNFDSIHITNGYQLNQIKFAQQSKGGKGLDIAWRDRTQEESIAKDKNQQKNIEFFLKKNQEIAHSLMKDRKSMSDIVYKARHIDDLKRNQNMPIDIRQSLPSVGNNGSQRYKLELKFPVISKSITKQKSSRENTEEIQMIAVMKGKEQPELYDVDEQEQNEPSYSEVTNVQIKKFLKLKQHAYKSEIPIMTKEEIDKAKKKKMHKNRQKLIKRQKEKLKNSLQEYLETKIIPKKVKKSEKDIKIQAESLPTEMKGKEEETRVQSNSENNEQTLQFLKKINQRSMASIPKTKKNVGLKTKISNKNMFSSDPEVTIYEGKMKNFRQFLFTVNLAHGVFDPIIIQDQIVKNDFKYKYFVGRGNNRELIKALMKRRFWWIEVDNPMDANFVWTQLRNTGFYDLQQEAKRPEEFYEGESVILPQTKVQNKKSYLYKAPLPQNSFKKVMTNNILQNYNKFQKVVENYSGNQQKFNNFENRLKFFPNLMNLQTSTGNRVHNHLQQNFLIGNKKALFYNLKQYYELLGKNVYDIIPLTFHINEKGSSDPVFKQFFRHFKQNQMKKGNKNIWIVKPGENSNRGNGISVFDEMYEINKILNAAKKNNEAQTFIIQKYIERPMLYKGRKFDIRHFMLATKIHGRMRLYWFGQGYVRTSSSDYSLEQISDIQIHLTNDAIQKNCEDYGKYEEGNKISYTELQRYFDVTYPNRKYSLTEEFYPRAKSIALDAFKASYLHMDPKNLAHNFEVFGLDFMIDASFNIWLIEVNTNPCLELSAGLLNRIIPNMIDNSFRLTLDPLFPPPSHYPNSLKHTIPDNPLDRLQYQLLFDEGRDGPQIQQLLQGHTINKNLQNLQEDQDVYQNDGNEVQINLD